MSGNSANNNALSPAVFTGVPPNDADRDFAGIPGELADAIAERMNLEKFAGVNCPPIIARILVFTDKIRANTITSAVAQGPDSVFHHLHKYGFNYVYSKPAKDNNREIHVYGPRSSEAAPAELHNKLIDIGYKPQSSTKSMVKYQHKNKPEAIHVKVSLGRVTQIHHITPRVTHEARLIISKDDLGHSPAHDDWRSLGFKHDYSEKPHETTRTINHHYAPHGTPRVNAEQMGNFLEHRGYRLRDSHNGRDLYQRGEHATEELHVHHNHDGVIHHLVHVVNPTKRHPALSRVSPIKSSKSYKWYHYHGEPRLIKNKRGTHAVVLQKGHRFGLRPAKTDPDKIRMIHPHTGKTIVFTLTKNYAGRLLRNARAV